MATTLKLPTCFFSGFASGGHYIKVGMGCQRFGYYAPNDLKEFVPNTMQFDLFIDQTWLSSLLQLAIHLMLNMIYHAYV